MIEEIVTDNERYPTLTDDGRRMLEFLTEHPSAPIFRNRSGNRLTASDIETVRAFEREVLSAEIGWKPDAPPSWLAGFIERCITDIPFYRRYGSPPARLADVPTISRADLSRDIAQFVPDHVPVARMMHFRTSGTTGHPLLIPSHPVVAANYLAFHKRALRRFDIELRHGRGQVGVILLGWQRKCFTYASVTPTMGESGLAKINLHPNDWHDPNDRAKYLDAMAPEVLAGDPISFAELLKLPLRCRPRALLSTSMALLPGLCERLEKRFGCPVLDLYSLNEAGPVAVWDNDADGHVLLQHQMFVEILDSAGNPLPSGERGEVSLTGGFNFCLPLLRYRTGDFAALKFDNEAPVLVGLEGRPPVRFRTATGEWLNNLEVTHALQRFALSQFTLHQSVDGKLHLRICHGGHERDAIRQALLALFGAAQEIEVEVVDAFDAKVIQYTSELSEALP